MMRMDRGIGGRAWLAAVVLAAVAIAACASGPGAPETPAATGVQLIGVEDLHASLEAKDFTLVNVHIPFEGELPGTDAHIPYDEIEQHLDRLPPEKGAKIVLYCRSGGMSDAASKTLVELGYTNVFDVPGGMRAWQEAGHELLGPPE